jgi:hypothetical protein
VSGKISKKPMGGSPSDVVNVAVEMGRPPVGVEMVGRQIVTKKSARNGKL